MSPERVPECWCAFCGNRADVAVNPVGAITPQPDDAALCNACGEWNIWDTGLTLRRPTPDEAHALAQSTPARLFREAVIEALGEFHNRKQAHHS